MKDYYPYFTNSRARMWGCTESSLRLDSRSCGTTLQFLYVIMGPKNVVRGRHGRLIEAGACPSSEGRNSDLNILTVF
jgi:hypothetical protein